MAGHMAQQGDSRDYRLPPMGVSVSNPYLYFKNEDCISATFSHLDKSDLRSAIIEGFNLPGNDSYTYHAIASVTLNQVQATIEAGTAHGLCDWYLNEEGRSVLLPYL